jgi:hypothetical protein
VRRGLANMQLQAYLTAAALNLKRLAVAFLSILAVLWPRLDPGSSQVQRQDDLTVTALRMLALARLAAT